MTLQDSGDSVGVIWTEHIGCQAFWDTVKLIFPQGIHNWHINSNEDEQHQWSMSLWFLVGGGHKQSEAAEWFTPQHSSASVLLGMDFCVPFWLSAVLCLLAWQGNGTEYLVPLIRTEPMSDVWFFGHALKRRRGVDRHGIRQVPEGSGEQRKMAETGYEVICGAPTTLAVKG